MTDAPQKRGPGQPRLVDDEETVRLSVRLPESLIRKIDSLPGKNRSTKARRLLDAGLRQIEESAP